MQLFQKPIRWIILSILLILVLTGCTQEADTEETNVYTPECIVQDLIDAIDDSNNDGLPSEIQLPPFCIYTLTQVENSFPWNNMIINNGLPAIMSDITIQGNYSTIQIQITPGDDPFGHFYLDVESELNLYDLFLKGGVRNAGGSVIINHGKLMAHNVKWTNNRALQPTSDSLAHGGAIYSYFGKVNLWGNTLFRFNYAGVPVPSGPNLGGAIYAINSGLTINDTYFLDNYVAGHGGAVYSEKTATHPGGGAIIFQNSGFEANEAVQDGGALYLKDERDGVYIASGNFNENLAGGRGGAIFSQDSDVSTNFPQFHNNQADYGGAVYTRRTAEGEMSLFVADNSVYTYNTAEESAGAFFSENTDLEARNTIFLHNEADRCGGLQLGAYPGLDVAAGDLENSPRINSQSEIAGSSISFNRAFYGDGGGACHLMGELVLDDVGFNGNQTPGYGGGLLSMDTLEVTESNFSDNEAYRGGGLAVGYILYGSSNSSPTFLDFHSYIRHSKISDNTTSDSGGGIWAHHGGSLYVGHSTVSGNTASSLGGGFYQQEGNLFIANSTLAENSAFRGGGLYDVGDNSELTLTHTTVAHNTATDGGNGSRSGGGGINLKALRVMQQVLVVLNTNEDCSIGPIKVTGGQSIFQDAYYPVNTYGVDSDGTCVILDTENVPQIGGFNGTYVPILFGSPLIDRVGDYTCYRSDDQIGTTRKQGIECEAGSIEYDPNAPPPPPPPPAPPPSEPSEETGDCDPFADMEISVHLLNINPETLMLPVYLRFPEAVAVIGEDGSIPLEGRFGMLKSYLTNQQGFPDRLYFMFTLQPNIPGTLQDLEIYKDDCPDPVFTQPRLTIPEVTAGDQPADDQPGGDQPGPGCNKDLEAEECKKAGGNWIINVNPPYCDCP